nr:zonadhesin-like protein 3 [Plectrocnemia conspersa]
MRKILQLLSILAVIYSISAFCVTKCPCENEEYVTQCTEGEPTCADSNPPQCHPFTGCRCKSGYVRHDGECIKKCECPCKCPNEVYVINSDEGEPTCENPDPEQCHPFTGCRCRPGYVRHNGKCIKQCECPCKCPNEVYVINSDEGEPTCENPDPEQCHPFTGCRCKPGYVRHNEKCIKQCECPCKCPNEVYVINSDEGEPTCENPNPEQCDPFTGCRCKPGFVRHNGKCIKQCECPCKCPNEVYVINSDEGEPTCENPDPEQCHPFTGCRCKPGYVRHNGKCIKQCECPCKCPNEVYVINSDEGEPTCENPDPEQCHPFTGCRCKPGYVRHNEKCIKQCECPCKCPNEVYVINSDGGEPTCENPDPEQCHPFTGCRCKPGYVRHNEKCIKQCECPCKCPNEVYVINSDEGEPTCENPNPKQCHPFTGCRCKPGYVRHNGKCIKQCECPCSCPNEVYVINSNEGEPTCEDPNPKQCHPFTGCRCRPGYVRHNGKCIKQSECPCKCPNEVYVINSDKGEPTCTDPNPKQCHPFTGCRCKPGYVRHDGKCIKQCECPCKCPNEVYVINSDDGEPTCENPNPEQCHPFTGCRCKPGYVRHNGKCIKQCECPCSCPNEVYVINSNEGEPTCEDPNPKQCHPFTGCRCRPGYVRHNGKCIKQCECPCKCPNEVYVINSDLGEPTCTDPNPKQCHPFTGCRCKPGYVRHDGKCIKQCECPCKCPNEVYVINSDEGEPTCTDPNPKQCHPFTGCRCKPGYVRHDGKCIKQCECPCKCPNEVYVINSDEGEPTCENPNPGQCHPFTGCRCKPGYVRHNGKCIKQCECPCKCPNEVYVVNSNEGEPTCEDPNPKQCHPFTGCRCRPGYVRHNGKCIKQCECPCSCPNEVYVINSNEGEPTCEDPNPKQCHPFTGCRCRPGYVRHNGKCIKQCECPCKCANEVYVINSDKGEPTCTDPNPKQCHPFTGCRCKPGYVRHDGECIKQCECPCKCPNEVYVINSDEGEPTCENPDPKQCHPFTGCRCRPGYVRHNGKCIKQCECPCKCPNEVYVINSDKGEPTCTDPDPKQCHPFTGCRCKPGYVRHDGKCIKQCECPCNCNEEYVVNSIKGEPTCDNSNPISCRPFTGCRCKPGYVRYNGECIKQCECPCKCPNEVYVINSDKGEPTCTDPNPKQCHPFTGCRCKPGYVRHNGKCIKQCDCPCDCNEEYVVNSIKGEPTCDNSNPISCRPFTGCRCKPGYVRYNGKCIKQCECPCKCPNEVYVINSDKGEPTCTDPNPKQCQPFTGCRCKPGYVRHDGKCIKQSECPCDCNEVYVVNSTNGEPTCENSNPISCRPFTGCRCKPGYVRNNGKCIKQCDCPCERPNEIFVIKSKKGEPTCTDPNPKQCRPFTGCRCKPGYVRYNGKCIKPCECPCDCNEEYVENSTKGEPTCDNSNSIICRPFTGCRCKPGYVRYNGKCIKQCDCPCKCPNEVYVINSNEGEPTCTDPNPPQCHPFTGCRCKPGYVRYNGKCIKQCECPCSCPNEVYVINSNEGEPTCEDPNPKQCHPFTGCRCKPGYVRHDGKCIKQCECPCKCPNQVYVINSNEGVPTCEDPSPGQCRPFTGCRCKPGYVLHNGKCIKQCECPCKSPNEIYVINSDKGEPTCEDPNPKQCHPFTGCRCKPGFVRYKGECVKPCECPCNCNEEYVVSSTIGEPTCDNPNPISCRPFTGCRCKKGYVRLNGKCIKQCECPCNCNEEYVVKSKKGEPTCDNPNPISCRPFTGCRCKKGYVRYNGQCIIACDCPPKCGCGKVWNA